MIAKQVIYLRRFLSIHFEWMAFMAGLLMLGLMNPYVENGPSLCLLDLINFPYCPGDGLGHSIAFTFRGDINNALEANVLGPTCIIVLISRIIYLINKRVLNINHKK